MKTDYTKQSDQDLTEKLRAMAKELKTLQGKKHKSPVIPEHFVFNAQVDSDITDVKSAQVDIGKELLHRDEKRQQQQIKKLEEKSLTGKKAAEELLEKLPGFADQVSVAFTALGKQYDEILTLASTVRKTNLMLLHEGKPQIANLFLEENHQHKIMKEQFRVSFGDTTANVFLPQNSPGFDIAEAVEDIQKACSTEAAGS